jgi:hypothetical protein
MHREIHSSTPVVRILLASDCNHACPYLLLGKIQRSVVGKHPEKRDPTNCVGSENPRIATLVLNRLWILRFRPSGRCIHARLLNVLNLICVQKNGPLTHVPTRGCDALNCTPETRPETDKNSRTGLPDDGYLSRDIAP